MLDRIFRHALTLVPCDLQALFQHPAVQSIKKILESKLGGRTFYLHNTSFTHDLKKGFNQVARNPGRYNTFCPKVWEHTACQKAIYRAELDNLESRSLSSSRCHLDPRIVCRAYVPIQKDGQWFGAAAQLALVPQGVRFEELSWPEGLKATPELKKEFETLGTCETGEILELLALLEILLSMAVQPLEKAAAPALVPDRIVGGSVQLQGTLSLIDRSAADGLPVHLHGESGTGKTLLARRLHERGLHPQGPFVVENCSAIPESLLESTLFGHKKGAFTGAHEDKKGLFEMADGGTLFLDEIGDMPLLMQVKLLRVLESGACRPVGGEREIPFKVRLVTASHKSLEDMVAAKTFREDLFYRVMGIRIHVPSLRERAEDIPALAAHYLGDPALTFTPEALGILKGRRWPGNIRQLRHFIQQLKVLAHSPYTAWDIDRYYPEVPIAEVPTLDMMCSLEKAKELHVRHVLEACEGRKNKAAKVLGVSFNTLVKYLDGSKAK